MLTGLRNAATVAWHSAVKPVGLKVNHMPGISDVWKRHESNYNAYPTFDTPSPYKSRRGVRCFYEYNLYAGGLLPRPKDKKWETTQTMMPDWTYAQKDGWTTKKALSGQNDYIDILGDGTVHPWQLIHAPYWLKGYRGNELQRIARQLKMQGRFIREMYPSKYHTLTKNLWYQYKKLNRRKHAPYWGGYRRFSRIDKPNKRY